MRHISFLSFLPVMAILLVAELVFSLKEHRELYRFNDTLANIVIGAVFLAANTISKITFYAAITWVSQFRFITLPSCCWVWILCFFGNDITFYVYHKSAHKINWFWASHAVHHSSEQFNISTAFRQSWTTNITGHFVFWLWMPLLGFSPGMMIVVSQVSFIYQYLLHTETIDKLPVWMEFVFNTPSHHRVHHGSNPEYLDKNHGGILIIWDRLFGTFCVERDKPVYGLTVKTRSQNPVTIVFINWKVLFQKAAHAGSFKNLLHYLIKPPGWMPKESASTINMPGGYDREQAAARIPKI